MCPKYRFLRRLPVLILFLLIYSSPDLRAQSPAAFSFEIKKPKNLEDKQLPSEKTGDKKFTLPRRVYQNTVTHYNWYFNGKEKLKEILARAKDAYEHVDPELVGNGTRFVVSEMAGRATITMKAEEIGLEMDGAAVNQVIEGE